MAFAAPSGPPVRIPKDVLDVVRGVFLGCNAEVTTLLSQQPMIREDSLDQALITHLDRLTPAVATR